MSEIKHQWNGSILTVISDSGASSADLIGPPGQTGPRGPQGPAGVIYDQDGDLVLDMSDYYSKTEVDDLIASEGGTVDLSSYATKTELTEAVNNIDMSSYATKEEMNEVVANAEAGYAKKEEIPSIAGLATEEFVQTKIEEIEHPITIQYGTDDLADGAALATGVIYCVYE